MAKKLKHRRETLPTKAVDPVTGKKYDVFVSQKKLFYAASLSVGHLSDAAYNIPQVLQNPTAIFEGLRKDEHGRYSDTFTWRCYCGIPKFGYKGNGKKVPPWPGEVFMVFVNADRVVFNWYWHKCDGENPNLPMGYNNRFKEKLL